MGEHDRAQPQPDLRQSSLHRLGVAGTDNDGIAAIVHHPDVIVLERRYGMDVQLFHQWLLSMPRNTTTAVAKRTSSAQQSRRQTPRFAPIELPTGMQRVFVVAGSPVISGKFQIGEYNQGSSGPGIVPLEASIALSRSHHALTLRYSLIGIRPRST